MFNLPKSKPITSAVTPIARSSRAIAIPSIRLLSLDAIEHPGDLDGHGMNGNIAAQPVDQREPAPFVSLVFVRVKRRASTQRRLRPRDQYRSAHARAMQGLDLFEDLPNGVTSPLLERSGRSNRQVLLLLVASKEAPAAIRIVARVLATQPLTRSPSTVMRSDAIEPPKPTAMERKDEPPRR